MKNLSEKEFKDRAGAEARARGIFIKSGMTNSITVAFELYQAILAEKERELVLSSKKAGDRPRSYFDKYERPKCPECSFDLMFRPLRRNTEGFNVQFFCTNPEHDFVLNSTMTMSELENELVLKSGD